MEGINKRSVFSFIERVDFEEGKELHGGKYTYKLKSRDGKKDVFVVTNRTLNRGFKVIRNKILKEKTGNNIWKVEPL